MVPMLYLTDSDMFPLQIVLRRLLVDDTLKKTFYSADTLKHEQTKIQMKWFSQSLRCAAINSNDCNQSYVYIHFCRSISLRGVMIGFHQRMIQFDTLVVTNGWCAHPLCIDGHEFSNHVTILSTITNLKGELLYEKSCYFLILALCPSCFTITSCNENTNNEPRSFTHRTTTYIETHRMSVPEANACCGGNSGVVITLLPMKEIVEETEDTWFAIHELEKPVFHIKFNFIQIYNGEYGDKLSVTLAGGEFSRFTRNE